MEPWVCDGEMRGWFRHSKRVGCLSRRVGWLKRSKESENVVSAEEVDLTELRAGESGTVVRIAGGPGLVRRLEALGIKPGVEVTKVAGQMLHGPVAFRVGSSQYAIGYGMARKVIVRR